MRISKEINISSTERKDVRSELINIFLKEEPGTGTGELCSHYVYYVDTLADGKRIFLKRPARLNKGFDFEVHVEDINFGTNRRRTMPSHNDIRKDLEGKLAENKTAFVKVRQIIERIYNCQNVDDEEIRTLIFTTGHPIEAIIKSIKWLFIEQDMTYWNWSGRNMLYSNINSL